VGMLTNVVGGIITLYIGTCPMIHNTEFPRRCQVTRVPVVFVLAALQKLRQGFVH
jgi:hypothetical protein